MISAELWAFLASYITQAYASTAKKTNNFTYAGIYFSDDHIVLKSGQGAM